MRTRAAAGWWTGFRLAAADVRESWRGHPGRMLPVWAAMWTGLAALMGLSCGWTALEREAARAVRELGADAFAVRRAGGDADDGWASWEVERLAAAVGEAGWVGGETAGATADVRGERVHIAGMLGDFAASRDWSWTPRAPDALDIHSGRQALWIPRETAARWGVEAGQTLTLGETSWVVAGLADTGGTVGTTLWGPAPAVGAWAGEEAARARVLRVRARGPGGPKEAQRRLAAALGNTEVEWVTPERLLARVRRWRRALAGALGWGGGLCLLLAVSGMASLQWMAVRERVAEIGLRRALGASRGDVAALFLAESAVLTLLAALAALATAWFLVPWVARWTSLSLAFSFRDALLPTLLALPVALLASAGPARAAASMDPAEALRE
ncbi:MAG: FtsX-like permease family protein [Kiritimatiellae bacterium]|nr:FtsX-like permease family protein [Kiritimatiellia bacterium]